MKKFVFMILCIIIAFCFFGCKNDEAKVSSSITDTSLKKIKIGVSMPTETFNNWSQDGKNMKKQLEKLGYEVDLQYAENNIEKQNEQVNNMISNGDQVLVIAPIDGNSLGKPLASAKENGIPIIAYDRLLMNSDAVTYYATFDNYFAGKQQGVFIRDTMDLDNAAEPLSMEIFIGDLKDNNNVYFYNGVMDILKPYIDNGKIMIPSGQMATDVISIIDSSKEEAKNRMANIVSAYYAGGQKLDIVVCSHDSIAEGVETALAEGYSGIYPVITGQDCEEINVKAIINGKQAMSVFKDTRYLVDQVVKMIKIIIEGGTPEINDTSTFDNGVRVVPTYLCQTVVVTKENYNEILIDSGYYKKSDIK